MERSLARQFAASLDWWRDAGVDCDFVDEPHSWLESEESGDKAAAIERGVAALSEVKTPPPPSIGAEDLPDTLEAFRTWWLETDHPAIPRGRRRVGPRGVSGSELMVVAPMPEAEDGELLLSGRQGTLIANIALSIGFAPDKVYWASALPAHIALPDWELLGAQGLGTALAHHVALARPSRLLLMGSRLPSLLGHDASAAPERFTAAGNVPALATFAPERLLDHARQRARLWHRLLEWKACA
ncbi:uracil-DNA glycosylase family protein [Aurantiacibacter spongiae]|uniref:Uracil-DNA glycosylase-like domain-containing protein n=1 Tax=Aurantiacibacter spongiae TaxID=2488860 RepID=A0A3N5CY50_9SPHN|nr:hypothetical protein [Aurantiacibacter spongiae]RPF72580.1 hypothetical protein EG799_13805 [Aurantiacibacter spongiae]